MFENKLDCYMGTNVQKVFKTFSQSIRKMFILPIFCSNIGTNKAFGFFFRRFWQQKEQLQPIIQIQLSRKHNHSSQCLCFKPSTSFYLLVRGFYFPSHVAILKYNRNSFSASYLSLLQLTPSLKFLACDNTAPGGSNL